MADPVLTELEATPGGVGPVVLRVPSDPTMSRVARLAAGGLASLAGCTIDELDDIKIAVSEVVIALVEHGSGGRLDLRFEHDDEEFVVTGTAAVDGLDLGHPDLRLCRTVLAGVCRHHDIVVADGAATIVAHVDITR